MSKPQEFDLPKIREPRLEIAATPCKGVCHTPLPVHCNYLRLSGFFFAGALVAVKGERQAVRTGHANH